MYKYKLIFLLKEKFVYTDLSTNEGIIVCSKFENNLHQNTSTKFVVHCEPIRKTPIIFTCDGMLFFLFFLSINYVVKNYDFYFC